MAEGHSIDLVDVESGQSLVNISDMSQSDYTSFAFSPDSKILAIGNKDSTVGFWDVSSLYDRETVSAHGEEGVAFWKIGDKQFISFSADGRTLITAGDNEEGPNEEGPYTIKMWRAATDEELTKDQTRK